MRVDGIGLFWEDEHRKNRSERDEKPKAEKRPPPEQFWLKDDYLPGLMEALSFELRVAAGDTSILMTDGELVMANASGDVFSFDTECYRNYWLCAFRSKNTGKLVLIERVETEDGFGSSTLNTPKLKWMMENLTLVSFNGERYDLPMISLACGGLSNSQLKDASDDIIARNVWPTVLFKQHRVHRLRVANHIDLKEVAPLGRSLKYYGGTMNTRRMQDLPFPPDTILGLQQIAIVRHYCSNDLRVTEELLDTLREEVELRVDMSHQYGVDLRSKSDAQIAEAVLKHELESTLGYNLKPPYIAPGTAFKYRIPEFIFFQTPQFKEILDELRDTDFIVSEDGAIDLPASLKKKKIKFGYNAYQMGIGGLHSTEKSAAWIASDDLEIKDADVTSYYPSIILKLRLFPAHLTELFLPVYKSIVDRRVDAKRNKLKVIADSLKIVINGSFGKFGNKHSIVYSPDFLIQTTITGQLSLLMMIEAMEMSGITVIQANTDGIVTACPKHLTATRDAIYSWWQQTTAFELEYTDYHALYSRDVNSYIAIKPDGGVKLKGYYANPKKGTDRLKKNPNAAIVAEAIVAYLTKGTPVDRTIRDCVDISKFAVVKNSPSGAVKRDMYLGKVVRWYHRVGIEDDIVKATGNQAGAKVQGSDGAWPLMELPDEFPTDVDYDFYILMALKNLQLIKAIDLNIANDETIDDEQAA